MQARKSKKGKSDKKTPKPLGIESARYNFQERSNIEDDFDFGQRIISRSVSALATSSSAATAASNILLCPTCSSSLTAAKTTSFGSISSGSKKTSTIATPISHENNIVEQQSQKEYYRSCNRGLFFMLLSLLVLVFWGKICCIFWTSTWLFIVPRWMVKDGRVDSSLAAMRPSEFKKKVVMEGLLARDRGRISS